MPKQTYAFEPNGPKRLEVSWKAFFKEITVRLDGLIIGRIEDRDALRVGQEFRLNDGSLVKVQLAYNLAGSELQVTRNGQPLPGSASSPETRIKTAAAVIYFIAGINLLLGILSLLVRSELLESLGAGWFSLVYGGFFLAMGILVGRKSLWALIAALVVYLVDSVLGLVLIFMSGGSPSVFNIMMRIILIVPLFQGIGAIREARKSATTPPAMFPPAVPPIN